MYSKKEKLIISHIASIQERSGKDRFTLDQIANRLYGRKVRPKSWRNSLYYALRNLGYKLRDERSWSLRRVSTARGLWKRGRPAEERKQISGVFEATGRFKDLLRHLE